MEVPKFTSGPWEISNSAVWAQSPWGARVRLADVSVFSPMNGIDNEANARLIAAAPDLYDALKIARGYVEAVSDADYAAKALSVVEAALAKAEGTGGRHEIQG